MCSGRTGEAGERPGRSRGEGSAAHSVDAQHVHERTVGDVAQEAVEITDRTFGGRLRKKVGLDERRAFPAGLELQRTVGGAKTILESIQDVDFGATEKTFDEGGLLNGTIVSASTDVVAN